MARPFLRVQVVAAAVLLLQLAAPMAASLASGVVPPVLSTPLPVPELPKTAPATDGNPTGAPPTDPAEVTGLVDDLDRGATSDGGILPSPEGTESPAPETETETEPSEEARQPSVKRDGGVTGSPATSSQSRSGPTSNKGQFTPAGGRSSADQTGGVLALARPFAPAVVIAFIGLLLLASAAQGHSRLLKRDPPGSRAGSWRL